MEKFIEYWMTIYQKFKSRKNNKYESYKFINKPIAEYEINKFINNLNGIRTTKENYNNILFRFKESHDNAIYYANQYGVLDLNNYLYKNNYEKYLSKLIEVVE